MARTLFALFAFAAVTASVSAYTENELTMIVHNIDLCLRDLPVIPGHFAKQIKDACGNKAWLALYEVSNPTKLTPVVVNCLRSYKQVSQQQVSTARQCLVKKLTPPYGKSVVDYTPADKREILIRVGKCLEGVPASVVSAQGKKPQYVCIDYAQRSLNNGAWKESLEGGTVRCLENAQFNTPQDIVAKTQSCLREELDKDL